MPGRRDADQLPPEALLAGLPEPMVTIAGRLRSLVRSTVPGAVERVRPGWRVIGYDVPLGRGRTAFFAWVMPQFEHVHLGFPRGVLLTDTDGLLGGAGEAKLARWLTARRLDEVDEDAYRGFLEEAASIARTPGQYAIARMVAERGVQRESQGR
jgi:hypothetical protein